MAITPSFSSPRVVSQPTPLDPQTRAIALRQIARIEQSLRAAKMSLMPSGVKPANRAEANRALTDARAQLGMLSL